LPAQNLSYVLDGQDGNAVGHIVPTKSLLSFSCSSLLSLGYLYAQIPEETPLSFKAKTTQPIAI